MPAPPPESDPAMIRTRGTVAFKATFRDDREANRSMRTTLWCRGELRTKGSRRALNGLTNVVDETLHELRIVAFGHDANERLRAGLADDQASAPFQFRLRSSDALLHAVGL